MGITVSRTNLAVGRLLSVLGDMPHERYIEFRNICLRAESPETHPDLVPIFQAVGQLMEAYEDDALAELSG